MSGDVRSEFLREFGVRGEKRNKVQLPQDGMVSKQAANSCLLWNEASTSSLFGLVLRYTPSTRRQTARGANSARRSRSLVVQDRKAQLAEARGVGDHVDLDDLAVCDREIEDEEQPTLPGHDESYGSIHQSRSR